VRDRPPQPRRRLLEADVRFVQPEGDRRAQHEPGRVAGLRTAQPRPRPRHRLRAAVPPIVRGGTAPHDPRAQKSCAMIFSMLRSASAVMVTNGLTLVLPGISEPSIAYRPG